jgi:hypothetical protein
MDGNEAATPATLFSKDNAIEPAGYPLLADAVLRETRADSTGPAGRWAATKCLIRPNAVGPLADRRRRSAFIAPLSWTFVKNAHGVARD